MRPRLALALFLALSAAMPARAANDALFLNRVTWGVTDADAKALAAMGREAWLERQLRPPAADDLPPEAAARVAAMTISTTPAAEIAAELAERRMAMKGEGEEARKAGQKELRESIRRLARETQERAVLRALYSPWQLREQMSWFWLNHFNVFLGKAEVGALLADYEDRAIRPHALGRFRDLLGAVVHHAAMLRYLDNAQNAAGHVNENLARELMELHTLGVDGGYAQADVQELARVLTGFGVAYRPRPPRLTARPGYVREGLFEFIPARHDFGAKTFLGEPIRAQGAAELDEALDRLARHPATARFVSRKLALYFVSDDPPAALVERLAAAFRSSDGDIAAVLRTLFASPEFEASLNAKFKDPLHYAFSAVRLATEGRPAANPAPILAALARMGEPLYGRQTPDGYPLARSDWASAGQMAARFDIARAIGYAAPALAGTVYYETLRPGLGADTRAALDQAADPREWNLLFLASPEFMLR